VSGGDGASRAVAAGIALWLVVALWPPLGAPLDASFDSSWRWAINVAAARHLDPGLLPYGPLGRWLEARATGVSGLGGAALAQIALRIAWLLALFELFRRRRRAIGVAAWCGLTIAAVLVAGRWPDLEYVALVLVLLAPWLAGESITRLGRANLVVAGGLAGLAVWLRPSLGAEALAVVVAGGLARGMRRGTEARWEPALLASGAGLGFVAGALATFGPPATLAAWLARLPSILAGYGAGQALFDRPPAERVALAAALLAIGGVALTLLRRSRLTPLAIAAAPALLAAAKYALVRQDVHAVAPIVLMAAVCGLYGLLAPTRLAALSAFFLGSVAVSLGVPLLDSHREIDARRAASLVLAGDGIANAGQALRWRDRERELRWSGGRRLAGAIDPADRALVPASGTVDVVPWRLSLLESLGLARRWQPSPVFQFYQVSNVGFDRITAGWFEEGDAAASLLVHFDPIDGRQPLWESPLTWRAIAARYAVSQRGAGLLVLRRLEGKRRSIARPLGSATLAWNSWIELPRVAAGERLLAEIDLTPTLAGRWHRAWKRAEPVWIDLRGRGGLERWRLLPDLAAEGLEIGAPPRGLAELADWLEGAPVAAPRRLRLHSADAPRYRPVDVRWLAVRSGD